MASILELIIKAVKQGTGFGDTKKEAEGLKQAVGGLNDVLGAFGVALGAQQLAQYALAADEAARANADAKNSLAAAAAGVADYQQALNMATQATRGMVDQTTLASTLTTLLGAELAGSAQEAAQLANAGAVLSSVFANVGGSVEKFNMLLSSGSPMLLNNFGLTKEMVAAKEQELIATRNLSEEEAKAQALKATLLDQAAKYSNALSEGTIEARQFEAAQRDLAVAVGQILGPAMADGRGELAEFLRVSTDLLSIYQPQIQGLIEWGTYANNLASGIGPLLPLLQRLMELARDAGLASSQSAESFSVYGQQVIQAANAERAFAASGREAASAHQRLTQTLKELDPTLAAAASRYIGLAGQYQKSGAAAQEAARAYREQASALFEQSRAAETAAFRQSELDEMQAAYQPDDGMTRAKAKYQAEQEAARDSAQAITDSFSEVGNQISSAVSGAVSQSSQDIARLLGIDEEGANRANEAVRRMAAVATGGLGNEWTQQLAQQLQGVDAAQAFVQAVSGGNNAAVMEEARRLALNPIVEMFDANLIASQIEQKLAQQDLQGQLNQRVQALLSQAGVQAPVDVMSTFTADTTTATQQLGQATGDLGATAQSTAATMQTGFDQAAAGARLLNQQLMQSISFLERISTLARQATGDIAGIPGQGGAAATSGVDSRAAAGGPSPL